MKHATLAALLIAAPAQAAEFEATGRHVCTSFEGWKYYFTVHALDDLEMTYSLGHDDVVSGWEVSCRISFIPVVGYCRDLELLSDDAGSEPHDRLAADCMKGENNG